MFYKEIPCLFYLSGDVFPIRCLRAAVEDRQTHKT